MKLNYGIIQKFAFGVSYTEKSDDKIIFSRFSEQERAVLSYGKEKSFTTAGVRLEFDTDSLTERELNTTCPVIKKSPSF